MCKVNMQQNGGSQTTYTAKKMDDTNEAKIPYAAQCWLKAYHAIPKVNKDSKLSFTFAIASAFFLYTVKCIAEQVMIHVFNWPNNDLITKEASASIASITHSTLLCIGLITAFNSHSYSPSEKFSMAPLWWQQLADALLQFCTGYMLYDAIVNILLLQWEAANWGVPKFELDHYLFLGHHLVTSTYMSSARIVQAGHMSAMMCMLLGELTNPLHNAYMFSEIAVTLSCCNGPTSQTLNYIIKVAFAAMYNLFRVIIGPIAMTHMSFDLLVTKQGRINIPLGLRIIWNLMIWAVVFGSISWIQKCHGILLEFAVDYNIIPATATSEL